MTRYEKLPPLETVLQPGLLLTIWRSYELHLRDLDRSARTIETYREGIRQLQAQVLSRGLSDDPRVLTESGIRAYLDSLRDGRKPATRRTRYRALKGFFRWLENEGEIAASPMARIKEPHVPQAPPKIPTDQVIKALLTVCQGRSHGPRRDLAIFRVAIDSGARRSELASMTLAGIHLEQGYAEIIGKGGAQERILFGRKAAAALDRYIRGPRSRHPWAASPMLWLGQYGPLTSGAIYRMVKRRATEAKLTGIWPHQFRHKFGHEWKLAGLGDEALMTAGRWRDPKSLRRYGASLAQARAQALHGRLGLGDRF